jgi:undecaprenyl-diphosphatase
MLELLDNLDKSLFMFMNVRLASSVGDVLWPVVTSDNLLRVMYALGMVFLLVKGGLRLRLGWLVLASALTLLLTDLLSAGWLKHVLDRPRPCHVFTDIHLLVNCGAGFAMPSSHAANAFGQAVLFGTSIKRLRLALYTFASLVAFSRVFVGVHYPLDIVAGAAFGSVIGLVVALALRTFQGGERRSVGIEENNKNAGRG